MARLGEVADADHPRDVLGREPGDDPRHPRAVELRHAHERGVLSPGAPVLRIERLRLEVTEDVAVGPGR